MKQLSYASVAILQSLAGGCRYGFDVMAETGLASGTVYPALRRLEKHGFVTAHWEQSDAAAIAKRPRRRYYRVTGVGAEALEAALRRFHGLRPRTIEPGPA